MGGLIDLSNTYCPQCGRGDKQNPFAGHETPHPGTNMCSISQPLGLYIPSGQTREWPCSVHGSHTLRG